MQPQRHVLTWLCCVQGLQAALLQALSAVEQQHLDRPEAQPPGASQRMPLATLGLILFHAIVQVEQC